MTDNMTGGMHYGTSGSSSDETRKVCLNKEDGAWYHAGAVICDNGHDWECRTDGKWHAMSTSDSCKI